ncbi:MAG: cupredoxin domain-containing protein, partial [Chloroflexi bacterium]|nr:cupredoxin domain-containing protein [Chloroflexota bacterium]
MKQSTRSWLWRPVLMIGLATVTAWVVECTAQAAPQVASRDSQETTTVSVVMREHAFEPSTIRLRAGQQAQLDFTNEGVIPHAVMIGLVLERLT